MEKYELQKLRDLPIEGVAERLGLHVCRHKSLCPFHDDRHPSMSYHVKRNTFRCFVCGASGGTIDLVMRHLNVGFLEACRWLADEHNIIVDEWKPCVKAEQQKPFDASRYERFFERPWLSAEARRFLFDERRIDARVAAWCRLTSWRDKHGVSWLQIPYYDMEGKLVGVQNRRIATSPCPSEGGVKGETLAVKRANETLAAKSPSFGGVGEVLAAKSPSFGGIGEVLAAKSPSLGGVGEVASSPPSEGQGEVPRFRFPYGSRCSIYNLPVLKMLRPQEPLYITEGCSDCWAMLSAGRKAIAIPSATLLKPKDVEMLSALTTRLSTPLHMFPDRDEPGERLFLQLQQLLPSLEHHQLPAGCKDFGEWWKGGLKN
ncbi:MAG: hypothetical protein IKK81_03635 [Prevotella sp.]|nr:hypothetical protein [Prevotella sp.]